MRMLCSHAVGIGSIPKGAAASCALWIALLISAAVAQPARAGSPETGSCPDSIPDVYDRVSPAVVSIAARSINPYDPTERISRVAGSGVVFDTTGLVLTNAHVVMGRQSAIVTLDDGTIQPAEMVGVDAIFDLAVLRIPKPAKGALSVVALGDSEKLRVGEEVLAIGNPLGLDQTLTRGVISAMNRILPNTPLSLKEPLIQTDTPINPGNSGGPLLNRCGEVIGITSAVIAEAQNIGFAIPINLVKAVLPSLINQGRIVRPWLGVQGYLVGRPLQDLLKIPLTDGLLVEVVEPGSPAAAAGIRGGQLDVAIDGQAVLLGGDIITAMDGKPVDTPEALAGAMQGLKVGGTVRLTLFRAGETKEVECLLPERPLMPSDIPGRSSALVAKRAPRVDTARYQF